MRGDSRRDLYAKTLALCGLGVLAGTGAVVDYWPVGVRFPTVAPLFDAPSPGALPLPSAVAVDAGEPAAERPRVAQVSAAAASGQASHVRRTSPFIVRDALHQSAASHTSPAHVALALAVPRLAERDFTDVDTRHVPELALISDDLPGLPSAALAVPAAGPRVMAAAVPALGTRDSDGDGLLAGAFKRTGSSIVKTGARTGGSIFDAVRVVGSAFKRAWPD